MLKQSGIDYRRILSARRIDNSGQHSWVPACKPAVGDGRGPDGCCVVGLLASIAVALLFNLGANGWGFVPASPLPAGDTAWLGCFSHVHVLLFDLVVQASELSINYVVPVYSSALWCNQEEW
jgi:hypothetical protein